MRPSLFSFIALCLIAVLGCQKDPSRTNAELESKTDSAPELVQAADGTLYSVDCLRQNATQIQSEGSTAMGQCRMKLSINSSGQSAVERGKFFYNSTYAWVYYPPTYWSPSYTSNTYSSGYSPYNDSSYSNNFFCAYIFGGNYNFNCYYMFGYNNSSSSGGSCGSTCGSGSSSTNYSSYYNPSCNYCLYAPNPSRCRNKCYRYDYFFIY